MGAAVAAPSLGPGHAVALRRPALRPRRRRGPGRNSASRCRSRISSPSENSGASQQTHTYVPSSWQSQYSPVNAGSVPARRATSNWVGFRRATPVVVVLGKLVVGGLGHFVSFVERINARALELVPAVPRTANPRIAISRRGARSASGRGSRPGRSRRGSRESCRTRDRGSSSSFVRRIPADRSCPRA